MIEIEQLRKVFGELVAVDGVSFTAKAGELFGLLGPNGAGKTTSISCMCGLLTPTSGHVRVAGHDVLRDGQAARRSLGVVPQEIALYEDLSAMENLEYWGGAQGMRGPELRDRAREVLELTGLLDRAKEPVKRYSGGMKRRLNFACGILHRPKVLLLDEPTVGVDPQSRVRLLELVRQQASAGACVLYTTHYMEEAESLCDRLAIIDHGKIIAQGTLQELRAMLGERDLVRLSGAFHPDAVRQALVNLAGAEIVLLDETQLSVAVPEASRRLPEIFAALASAGADVRGTTLTQPSLESLFIKLTGKELREYMRFILVSAIKDLRRLMREPAGFVTWLGVPLLMTVLFSAVFGRGDVQPQGKLLLADEDQSMVSSLISGAFSQGPLGNMITIEKVSVTDGLARIGRGDGSAFLRVPKGFGDAWLNGRPVQLDLLTNPAQRIIPGIIEETLSMLVEGAHYTQWILGDQIQMARGRPPSDINVAETAVRVNAAIRKISTYLNPPAIVLETKVIEVKKETTSFGAIMMPGMLVMSILFMAGGFASESWKEKSNGTLRRLAMTPARVGELLAGRILVNAAVLLPISAAAMGLGALLLNAPIRHAPIALLWIVCCGCVIFLLVLLIQLHASSERGAQISTSLVTIPLMMLGGSLLPFETMPAWMARIGRMTPNGFALTKLRALMEGTMEPAALAMAFAGVLVIGAAAFWIAERRIRTVFLH